MFLLLWAHVRILAQYCEIAGVRRQVWIDRTSVREFEAFVRGPLFQELCGNLIGDEDIPVVYCFVLLGSSASTWKRSCPAGLLELLLKQCLPILLLGFTPVSFSGWLRPSSLYIAPVIPARWLDIRGFAAAFRVGLVCLVAASPMLHG